ncbi:hypothetical protein ACFWOJ_19955 [Streptomyces sp. NPDC058439]|uniref:hypothetical protein n=1 Tax=Streptomyces sp. NPDC058439 TaxID=3346500 RepID=UPI00364ACAB1
MLSQKKIGPRGRPYYCNGVMVGDGYRPASTPLRAARPASRRHSQVRGLFH